MTAKDNKTRQADFKARMKKNGLVQITIWIPEKQKKNFEIMASQSRVKLIEKL